jgi:hypothetical protein
METVLSAIVVIFVIIFAVMTFTQAFVATQDQLGVSLQEMEARLDERAATSLAAVDAWLTDDKAVAALVFRNTGTARLADFDRWDLMVDYYDDQEEPALHGAWLPYTSGVPLDGEWTVEGLYLDAAAGQPEAFEPGIFNPGEEMLVHVRLDPEIGLGQALQASLATQSGIPAAILYTRNYPPVLDANTGLSTVSGGEATLTPAMLLTSDEDQPPEELIYTITVPPAQGTLSLSSTFTQLDIDRGQVVYTHTGSGDDSFSFTVTDGEDTLDGLTFDITVNNADPVLTTNAGLAVAAGDTAAIDNTILQTTDADDDPSALEYTIVTVPARGMLSLGATFTQEDIDNGLLTYTRTGSGGDSFAFTVSDGKTSVGPFGFGITDP